MCLDCTGMIGLHVHPFLKELKKGFNGVVFFDFFGGHVPKMVEVVSKGSSKGVREVPRRTQMSAQHCPKSPTGRLK